MTHRECLELVAPSDHVNTLIDAAKYASVASSEEWMQVMIPATLDDEYHPGVYLQMRTHAQKEPPLRPRLPMWQPGQPAGDKVIQWTAARLVLGRRFGLAKHVLHELNDMCENGAQMRFIWPVCMHLVQGRPGGRVETWAEKHAAFKPCRFLPQISPRLKKAIQDSAALLTSAVLVGDDQPEVTHGEVGICLHEIPWFDHGGTKVFRM
jgi:hypothetical protein